LVEPSNQSLTVSYSSADRLLDYRKINKVLALHLAYISVVVLGL
jgi:hypothetical protein